MIIVANGRVLSWIVIICGLILLGMGLYGVFGRGGDPEAFNAGLKMCAYGGGCMLLGVLLRLVFDFLDGRR